ncbi:MAG: AMP-binding protein, partial [Photobacterium halotolerans]
MMAITVLDGFYQQVSANKDKTALVYQNTSITYYELNQQSDQLCACLKSNGVQRGDIIPIIAQRTPNFIIGMLAVMKAGATYIPVDSSYPERRIQDILNQVNAALILTTDTWHGFNLGLQSVRRINIEDAKKGKNAEADQSEISGGQLAYIIFTSGTTGTPKGVMIAHSALLNLITWHNHHFDMSADCRTSLVAGISFDVAQWEVWSALMCGATLCIPDDKIRLQPDLLLPFFAGNRLTHAFVPTVFVESIV